MKKGKKAAQAPSKDGYDFSAGVRGRYAGRTRGGSLVVRLEPEVAKVCPDSRSVKRALRLIADVARKSLER